jgi:hypothetical protein
VRYTFPTTSVSLEWTLEYGFFWMKPLGVSRLKVYQFRVADATHSNQITLHSDRAYRFQDQGPGRAPGKLYIRQDRTVPLRQAWVGVSMAGSGILATPAQPNLELVLKPPFSYWITFGDFRPGELLDMERIKRAVRVEIPFDRQAVSTVLHADNTLTVEPRS